MGDKLKVDTEDLITAGSGMRRVAIEFEQLDRYMGQYDRKTVGHQWLWERLQDFSDGWDDTRAKMVDEIMGLGEVAQKAGEAYREIETQLVDSLLGKKPKGGKK
ncbi:hypothetical protein [Streptomyces sp. MAR4 CNX-425]|uniref:hypothetical protein n=1 Tax=Streptomyces sp. MAR4 CNX-425 TaxID=3406343 RepID=UPI003B4FFFD6